MFKEFSANRLQAGYGCILLEVWQKLKCKYLYTLILKKWILTATCGKITHRQYEQNFKKKNKKHLITVSCYSAYKKIHDITYTGKH